MNRFTLIAILVCFCCAVANAAIAQEGAAPNPGSQLISGNLAEGEKALTAAARNQPDNAALQFELGALQFFQAVEHLAQSLYRHGALSGGWTRNIPLLRVATPAGQNPEPQVTRYEDTRKILQTWIDDLAKAEKTLANVKGDDVKLPLRIGMVRLDFNGDGKASEEEALWKLYSQLNAGARNTKPEDAQGFVVMLDAGDVHWLRGYCHLLMAFGEMALAYDAQNLFDTAGHIMFARAESPHPWVRENVAIADLGQGVDIADVIAFIHTIRLPVKEEARMDRALEHLRAMIAQSRQSWDKILAETDNDQEWIPNANQRSVLPNSPVTPEMIKTWQAFLDEADAILTGKKLVPFWRSKELGVNVNKVFTDPRPFDLILWLQGTAVTPYLEKDKELSQPGTWSQFMRVFRGEFIGYAIWFN